MKELRLMYWSFSDTLCLLIPSFGVKHPSFNAKSYRDVAFGLNFCILPKRRPEILELFLNLTLLVYNMLHFNYTTVLVKETVTPKQHMDLITHPGKSRTSGFFFCCKHFFESLNIKHWSNSLTFWNEFCYDMS